LPKALDADMFLFLPFLVYFLTMNFPQMNSITAQDRSYARTDSFSGTNIVNVSKPFGHGNEYRDCLET